MGDSDQVVYEKEKELLNRKLILMGKDVSEIPCFRNSFLYGILGGMVSGIASFAFTSKIRRSTSVGFWSYIGTTSVYWVHCRYKYSSIKFEYEQISHALRKQVLVEGTDQDMNKQMEDTNPPSHPTK